MEAAKVFQQFLMSGERQRALLSTGMRPADPRVKLDSPIDPAYGANPGANVAAVNVPETLVLDRIVEVWHKVRKRAVLVIVFDKSGSMSGEDWLMWMPFDNQVYLKTQGLKADVGERLASDFTATPAGGGTALYDAVTRAYRILEEQRTSRGRNAARYGIVILSDGQDTNT